MVPYTLNHIFISQAKKAPLKLHLKVSHVHLKKENVVVWIKQDMNEQAE